MSVPPDDHGLEALVAQLEEIRARLGRRVRVLHIGNIANNAFHNAKLQRKLGLDADVLCYDYYHIMGCPEWEDADFIGFPGDEFAPIWYHLDMKGYQRPKWFAQGPFELAARYLILKRRNSALGTKIWRNLGVLNGTLRPTGAARIYAAGAECKQFARRLFWLFMRPDHVEQRVLKTLKRLPLLNQLLSQNSAPAFTYGAGAALRRIAVLLRELKLRFSDTSPNMSEIITERAKEFCAGFREQFPNRSDQLTYEECLPYVLNSLRWNQLFQEYDIIQAYSTDVMWPMLTNTPYFAFEHGTLRDIPNEDSIRGRMTALAYSKAEHVFVTNADCMQNARALAGDRVSFINHPFDEDDALAGDWVSVRDNLLREMNANHLVLHPTRQDWVEGTGFADKGNDVFLKAFIRMHALGFKIGLVMCEWGRNVRESRALLDEAGLTSFVRWERPMSGRRLLTVAQASEIVVDQFKLGAFGGVTFKALAAACCVCTKLDVSESQAFFGEAPPVVNCSTEDEIVDKVTELLRHPERLKERSKASREWVDKFHSGRQVSAAHIQEYVPYLRAYIGLAKEKSAPG